MGRYTLLGEITRGGLTSIHLARQPGGAGLQRLMAVRKLLPDLPRRDECIELLLHEARLTSGLHHANIVGVHEVGADGGCHIVMDYVEGESLAVLLKRAGQSREPRLLAPLLVDALNGLSAVHGALDEQGERLIASHQAPHARHVLVGTDGTARLIDFTQALSRLAKPVRKRSERLKLEAMAPEQALSPDATDHRSDLFVMGLVLWEALTGERLFAGESDEQTFQNLQHRRIPRPSEVGLRPPRCFDAICLHALERDPKNRYASALEMARDLRDTALNQALYATTAEIGQWVSALCGAELRVRRRMAGSEAPSQEIEAGTRRNSGTFTALSDPDPYGSGRIYGGSFARIATPTLPPQPPGPFRRDLEQTPTMSVRTAGSHGAANQQTGQQRPRKPTLMYGEAELPAPPPPPPAATTVDFEELPTRTLGSLGPSATEDAATKLRPSLDDTQPTGFVPAAPGARRDTGVLSPGAYSAVDPARRSSRPPREAGPEPHAAEAEPTSAAPAAHLSPAPLAPEAAPKSPLAGATARELPSTIPPPFREKNTWTKPRAIVEQAATSAVDHRRDSTPIRRSVPSTPVGAVFPDASPRKAPETFELPTAPRAIEQLGTANSRLPIVLLPPIPDSISPPLSAAKSTPPLPAPALPAKASRSMWAATALLAAIILLAVFVGARRWLEGSEAAATSVRAASPGTTSSALPPPASTEPAPPARSAESPAQPASSPLNEPASAASALPKDESRAAEATHHPTSGSRAKHDEKLSEAVSPAPKSEPPKLEAVRPATAPSAAAAAPRAASTPNSAPPAGSTGSSPVEAAPKAVPAEAPAAPAAAPTQPSADLTNPLPENPY